MEVEAWEAPPPAVNVARATNGGTASASSYLGSPYNAYPSYVNDGSRRALNGAIWLDNTYATWPDWVQIDFNGSKTISEIDVITQQDDYQNPVEPTLTQTFSLYGITAFDVHYWDGSAWQTVPNGSVTGNNKVWRQFTFAPITTSKIRVVVNAGQDNAYSRVVEVEAWTVGSGGGGSSANVKWLMTDHLGTPRMVFDQTGSLANVSRHDYLPFGEELFGGPPSQPGVGGRTTTMGYTSSDNVRQKFTSKERDNETGLDYFLARYYSSTQGRFTSPDEFKGGPDELFDFADDASDNPTFYADREEPQSLNKYQYCYNNPLAYIDPDGHTPKEKPSTGHMDEREAEKALAGWRENVAERYRNLVMGQKNYKPPPVKMPPPRQPPLRTPREVRATSRLGFRPAFHNLKDHAARHGHPAMGPPQYYDRAVDHMVNYGARVKFYHDGQFKFAHITRLGMDKFLFTSTSLSRRTIFTSYEVSGQTLRNMAINAKSYPANFVGPVGVLNE